MSTIHNERILFIGDSITDCNRNRSEREHDSDRLGHGYVSFIHALLQATYPSKHYKVTNKGIGGNTIRDLQERWQRDVLAFKPDLLFIMIGINDVWRQFDQPSDFAQHVYPDEFTGTYRQLVEQSSAKKICLLSPFYIQSEKGDPMRKMMDHYGDLTKSVAETCHVSFIDLQKQTFDPLMQGLDDIEIAQDRIHPSSVGHMAIARTILKHLDFKWDN
ncbi:SGNH/GDSL hydrolase family protein [Shouchella miscanthi]|uniref:SGNH/GDSL hydrolase family protein n=1 Tax=Shouchella miscanthi TaxID=2598861 RepID=A0ABU6NFL9_9BACI|nr:SGNH/GDSL hydrolase family protein [Shouchella miscanthi]